MKFDENFTLAPIGYRQQKHYFFFLKVNVKKG